MNKHIALISMLITSIITGCNSGASTPSEVTTNSINQNIKADKQIKFLRAPLSEIKNAGNGVLVSDKGTLITADYSGYTGNLLFSGVGLGTRPLVLIGTKYDVMSYMKNSTAKIENRFAGSFDENTTKDEEAYSVKGIYMGVVPYVPSKTRMNIIYSPIKIGTELMAEVLNAFGISAISDSLSISAQYGDIFDAVLGAIDIKDKHFSDQTKLKKFEETDSTLYYFQFTYYKQDGFVKISDNKNEFCTDKLCSVNEIPKIIGKRLDKDLFKIKK